MVYSENDNSSSKYNRRSLDLLGQGLDVLTGTREGFRMISTDIRERGLRNHLASNGQNYAAAFAVPILVLGLAALLVIDK